MDTDVNFELLARVRDRIAEVGDEHCDMFCWSMGEMPGSGEPPCGTTACIGGHTLAVAYGRFNAALWQERSPGDEAARLLGLPALPFSSSMWPARYRAILRDEGHAKAMLAVCDALLDGTLGFDYAGRWA